MWLLLALILLPLALCLTFALIALVVGAIWKIAQATIEYWRER